MKIQFCWLSTLFLPSYVSVELNKKCSIQNNRANFSSVTRSLSKWAIRILCRKSFLLTSTLRNLNAYSMPHLFPFILLFPGSVFKHKEILLMHTFLFSNFPSCSLPSLVWLAFKDSICLTSCLVSHSQHTHTHGVPLWFSRPGFLLIRPEAHTAYPHLLCSLRSIRVSFLLGLMGISQRETIIALEKSIDLHCVVHLVFGVQGYFLKMEDQFRRFRMRRW